MTLSCEEASITEQWMQHPSALAFATHWHAGQRRKGKKAEPYMEHPLRVAACMIRCGARDQQLLTAALLHDLLEDTPCPPERIREQFGVQVLHWVLELSDRKELLKAERKQQQIDRSPLLSQGASWIRIADKIDNLSNLAEDPPLGWSLQRQREYLFWSIRVVQPLQGRIPPLDQLFQQTCYTTAKGLRLPETWIQQRFSHTAASPTGSHSVHAGIRSR